MYNTFWMRGPEPGIADRLAHHCTTSLTIFTHTSFHIYKICTSTRDHYVVWNPSLSFSAFSCSSAILSASFLLCSSRNLGLSTEIKNIHLIVYHFKIVFERSKFKHFMIFYKNYQSHKMIRDWYKLSLPEIFRIDQFKLPGLWTT